MKPTLLQRLAKGIEKSFQESNRCRLEKKLRLNNFIDATQKAVATEKSHNMISRWPRTSTVALMISKSNHSPGFGSS